MKQKTKFKETEIGMIPEDWRVARIPEVSSNFDSKRKPLSSAQRSKMKGVYPYYGAAGIIDYVDDYKYDGDFLLIAEDGSVISSGSKPMLQLPKGKFWVSNHAHVLQCKTYSDTLFLYYQLKNTVITPFITGAVQLKLSQENLNKIKIAWIDDNLERNFVTKILSDLDAKIELNQNISKNLEAIGLALFNKWFNLEEIPKNWATKPLDKIAEYLNGLPLQKYPAIEGEEYLPVIKIRELRNGITEQTDKANLEIPEEYIIEDGDVLFSWSGTLEVELWTNGQGALNQHLFKVSSKEYPKWFYYYWTKHHLKQFRHIAKGKATTMGHIQRHNLTESEVIIPDKKSLENMGKVMSPIIERIIDLRLEARNLSKIRDSLLPRLMSGKIRVPVEVRA